MDTSALLALLHADDERHPPAARFFAGAPDTFLTHNYVVLETIALAQRRLGATAVRVLIEEMLPAFETLWVGEGIHRSAETALLAAPRRRVSFVDWVSFEVMRREGIERAFAFDRNFATQGFDTVP